MFLIFLASSAALRGAISDAQSLRATETQSMKWLTELRYEVAMNHSFEFIVVNEIVCSVAIAQILCSKSLATML
jgi:hypothetical protein